MADDLQQNGGSAEDVAAARAGAFDTLLKVAAAFYRAGAAASAERIKELEARVDALERQVNTLRRVVGTDKIVPLLKGPDQ